MECIICKESGDEPLFDNVSCECKYKRHNSCWIDYVHSTDKVKCLLCRQEIKAKPNKPRANTRPIPPTPSPTSPTPSAPTATQFIRITPTPMFESYQNTEVFIIPDEPSPRPPPRPQPQISREEQHRLEIQNMTPQEKILRILLLLAFLACLFLIVRFLLF